MVTSERATLFLIFGPGLFISCVSALSSAPQTQTKTNTEVSPPTADTPQSQSNELGERLAEIAVDIMHSQKHSGRRDCSGLITAILDSAGLEAQGNTRSYWHEAQSQGRVETKPIPGNLAFFDRTYDANRNGKVDDELTHIAIVIKVENDGTVHLIHRGSGKVRVLLLNLKHRDKRRIDGKEVNDYLRAPGYGPKNGKRLSAQLLRGFARVSPSENGS